MPKFIITATIIPDNKPGIAKVNPYTKIVVTRFLVLNPRARSIPN
jgi:hypothetical protein